MVEAGYAFITGSKKNLIKQTFFNVDKKIREGFNFFTTENPFETEWLQDELQILLRNRFNF